MCLQNLAKLEPPAPPNTLILFTLPSKPSGFGHPDLLPASCYSCGALLQKIGSDYRDTSSASQRTLMTQVSSQHQRKILPTHYFQFSEKITSSNNNLETEFDSQVYILSPPALCKPGSLRLLLHMLQLLLSFPQRRKLDEEAGWKATMRDKPMPKASLEAQDDMLPNRQIFHLQPQLWKTVAQAVGCGS